MLAVPYTADFLVIYCCHVMNNFTLLNCVCGLNCNLYIILVLYMYSVIFNGFLIVAWGIVPRVLNASANIFHNY